MGLTEHDGPVLVAMGKMTPCQRRRAEEILQSYERRAVEQSTLNPGARETITELREKGIRIGVLTRNNKANTLAVAEKHNLKFDIVVGREDGPVKPDAFGVVWICKQFGVEPSQTMLVGDYLYGNNDQKGWSCFEFKTGKLMYTAKGVGKGSLVYADGMLYCLGERGLMGLIKADPGEHQIISSFQIPEADNKTWAHPVISDGKLYIRSKDRLFVYSIRKS